MLLYDFCLFIFKVIYDYTTFYSIAEKQNKQERHDFYY
ncbi:hypothetical protein SC1083_1004 [Aggregatibacter actinomycetemcomitans serotype e str. SC1083]|uniref:Uncharacterized protein n=1 Tax=Aggregatibacter actinomycetemcomitans serotype e str. SC1083 TaxID=907488 RepID=G4A857_AGGAC|nr:hypothetical protein SC1083_1004 [Aggregatibacter actinomycetemcomitans serotype e str. SC1083]